MKVALHALVSEIVRFLRSAMAIAVANRRDCAISNFCQSSRIGNENSAQSFSDRSFWKSLRVVDVRTFASWISAPKCLFFQDFERPDRSLGRDIRANDPRTSAGYPARKLPLWADFSFLNVSKSFSHTWSYCCHHVKAKCLSKPPERPFCSAEKKSAEPFLGSC